MAKGIGLECPRLGSHCMKIVGSGSMVHGKSSDLELLNVEERVFFATTCRCHQAVCQAAFPNISESTKRSKLRMILVDSSLKVKSISCS